MFPALDEGMAEPRHSSSKGPEDPDAVTPAGKARWLSRARVGVDRRISGLSQKLSIFSALLLCASPLLLVHAGSPPRGTATGAAVETAPQSALPLPPTSGIEIVRTRPVTTAAAPPPLPAPAAKTPPAPETAPKAAAPPPAAPVEPAPPATWSEAEITAARQACSTVLAPLKVSVQELPPLKQDKCGTPAPVALKRLGPAAGGVELSPPATLNCAMVAKLDAFVEKTLQPAAREVFGSPVVKFNQASGYVCRGRNGDLTVNGKLSEHALANALDVASFTLADGRVIDVGKHWGPAARDFKNVPPNCGGPGAATTRQQDALRSVFRPRRRPPQPRPRLPIPPRPRPRKRCSCAVCIRARARCSAPCSAPRPTRRTASTSISTCIRAAPPTTASRAPRCRASGAAGVDRQKRYA